MRISFLSLLVGLPLLDSYRLGSTVVAASDHIPHKPPIPWKQALDYSSEDLGLGSSRCEAESSAAKLGPVRELNDWSASGLAGRLVPGHPSDSPRPAKRRRPATTVPDSSAPLGLNAIPPEERIFYFLAVQAGQPVSPLSWVLPSKPLLSSAVAQADDTSPLSIAHDTHESSPDHQLTHTTPPSVSSRHHLGVSTNVRDKRTFTTACLKLKQIVQSVPNNYYVPLESKKTSYAKVHHLLNIFNDRLLEGSLKRHRDVRSVTKGILDLVIAKPSYQDVTYGSSVMYTFYLDLNDAKLHSRMIFDFGADNCEDLPSRIADIVLPFSTTLIISPVRGSREFNISVQQRVRELNSQYAEHYLNLLGTYRD